MLCRRARILVVLMPEVQAAIRPRCLERPLLVRLCHFVDHLHSQQLDPQVLELQPPSLIRIREARTILHDVGEAVLHVVQCLED